MTEQQLWMIFVTAVVTAAVVGFVFGRISGGGKARVASLEAEVSRQKEQLSGYKRDVESHFDRTATLVASMAGSLLCAASPLALITSGASAINSQTSTHQDSAARRLAINTIANPTRLSHQTEELSP